MERIQPGVTITHNEEKKKIIIIKKIHNNNSELRIHCWWYFFILSWPNDSNFRDYFYYIGLKLIVFDIFTRLNLQSVITNWLDEVVCSLMYRKHLDSCVNTRAINHLSMMADHVSAQNWYIHVVHFLFLFLYNSALRVILLLLKCD